MISSSQTFARIEYLEASEQSVRKKTLTMLKFIPNILH